MPTLRLLINSRWTFAVFQLLDLLTTMLAFRLGAVELNPLVAHLAASFGLFGGVLASKLITVTLAMRVKKLLWVANLVYAGVVAWNLAVLVLKAAA